MAEFVIAAERSPDLDDAEIRRRLSRIYALLLSHRTNEETDDPSDTAESDEPTTAGDPLAIERQG